MRKTNVLTYLLTVPKAQHQSLFLDIDDQKIKSYYTDTRKQIKWHNQNTYKQ